MPRYSDTLTARIKTTSPVWDEGSKVNCAVEMWQRQPHVNAKQHTSPQKLKAQQRTSIHTSTQQRPQKQGGQAKDKHARTVPLSTQDANFPHMLTRKNSVEWSPSCWHKVGVTPLNTPTTTPPSQPASHPPSHPATHTRTSTAAIGTLSPRLVEIVRLASHSRTNPATVTSDPVWHAFIVAGLHAAAARGTSTVCTPEV